MEENTKDRTQKKNRRFKKKMQNGQQGCKKLKKNLRRKGQNREREIRTLSAVSGQIEFSLASRRKIQLGFFNSSIYTGHGNKIKD